MKEAKIFWLFKDGSVAHICGRPISFTPIAWKFEHRHDWNYDMGQSPDNYYKPIRKKLVKYVYEVIAPITDYRFNLKVGDLMTRDELLELGHYYRCKVKDLDSPVIKEI